MAKKNTLEGDDHYKAYDEYAKNLRIWFVGFGVGLAALIVGNKDVIKNIKDNPIEKYSLLGGLFAGVILQVILSLINKYSNWINCNSCRKKSENTRIAKFFTWLGDQIWIDVIFDILSVAALIVSSIFYLIIVWEI